MILINLTWLFRIIAGVSRNSPGYSFKKLRLLDNTTCYFSSFYFPLKSFLQEKIKKSPGKIKKY